MTEPPLSGVTVEQAVAAVRHPPAGRPAFVQNLAPGAAIRLGPPAHTPSSRSLTA